MPSDVPFGGLSNHTSQPSDVHMDFTINNPSPVPDCFASRAFDARKNGLKIFRCSFFGMDVPLFTTVHRRHLMLEE